jgi:1-deoxy-D-xylulose-5-phosphate reductoisomerase
VAGLKRVTVLGSTGSIGTQALDVIYRSPGAFSVHALSAGSNAELMADQISRFGPSRVAMADVDVASDLRGRLTAVEVLEGADGIVELAGDENADVVLNAVVGAAGLRATLASLEAGRTVALANKESCVAGGELVAERLAGGANLVPVDSEHASIHMCLRGEDIESVERVILTASGGPFRGKTRAELEGVTASDALRHPTWDMGAKITVDSATLMNKGLEVLEAHVLFGLDFGRIEVVCHPQSIVHCLVEFTDGSWKAALGPPDMRVPIAYAMGYPDRPGWGAEGVDWSAMSDLTFEPVDTATFRCLDLAYRAGRAGGTAPATLNAANEVAVGAFLGGRIGFVRIAEVVEEVLQTSSVENAGSLDGVLEADGRARRHAQALCGQ